MQRKAGRHAGSLPRVGRTLALATALLTTPQLSSAQTADSDTTKIIIGAGQSGISQLPLAVADQQGFFKKAGLDVTLQTLSGGTPSAMASFATGAVNVLNLSAPELIQYLGKKVIDGKAFAEGTDQSYDIVASNNVADIQDIKGKIIGISAPNSGDQTYFLGLMLHYGISPKDVTFISVGNPTNRLAALSAGSIQVTAAANNLRDQSGKAGKIILKSGDSPVAFPINLFIGSKDLVQNHKPLLKRFTTALSDATAWMKANPADAAAVCAKIIGGTPDACKASIALSFDRSISSKFTWSSTGAVNIDGVKSALEVMATIEPDTKNLKIDDVVDTSIAGTTP